MQSQTESSSRKWSELSRKDKVLVLVCAVVGLFVSLWIFVLSPSRHTWSITAVFDFIFVAVGVMGCLLFFTEVFVKRSFSRRLAVLLGSSLLTLGAGGFVYGFLCAEGFTAFASADTELPLGDVESIAVSPVGHIYLATSFYSRIQEYDSDGQFIRGWFVDASGGAISVGIDAEQHIEVYAVRPDTVYTYDEQGKLLGKRKVAVDFTGLSGKEAKDQYGTRYLLRGGILFPRVVRIEPAGWETTLISMPWYRWCWMGPLPAWGIGAIGMLLLIWGQSMRNKST